MPRLNTTRMFTMPKALLALVLVTVTTMTHAEAPYRGLAIAAPPPAAVDRFVTFMEQELAPRGVDLLVLRVDHDFEFQSHPELRSDNPLSLAQVRRIAEAARRHDIRVIPQINLLGHQSWHGTLGKLLSVYPQFDETPHVEMPEQWEWPNEDGLYCKSYCPLHPEVHDVVFALVDELVAAFGADAFHAGMDEVFYIGDDQCPRCAGKDKAKLYAGEVTRIRDHLAENDVELWIWGDRLLDGEVTGLGEWEAATNDTHRAIDMIPKDVVINDWHYERAEPTPTYFAMKGFRVLAAPWNRPEVGLAQQRQAEAFRENANPTLANRHLGILQTYWSSAESFMDLYESGDAGDDRIGAVNSLKQLFPVMSGAGD